MTEQKSGGRARRRCVHVSSESHCGTNSRANFRNLETRKQEFSLVPQRTASSSADLKLLDSSSKYNLDIIILPEFYSIQSEDSKFIKMTTVQNGKLFSCGNHSVETTKGMLHFGDPSLVVCILAVPSTMTVKDLIQFLSQALIEVENIRIVREVNQDSSYIVLLRFREEKYAKQFYVNYDEIPFNSLEDNKCRLLYVTRVETFAEDPAKIEETSNCAVCQDRMYPDSESIITILCNHSFHVDCLSKCSDPSPATKPICPVCRYCQTPECKIESKCMDCPYEGESLWMCIICGYVSCGRYINGHAYEHFNQTQHTYAMQLTDNQVWDYAGDNYVHRLLANKVDGKPVEVESEGYRQSEEKLEAVQLEYTYLLNQQLESQKKYYEKLAREKEKQYQKQLKETSEKNQQLVKECQELQDKNNQLNKDKIILEKKLRKLQTKLTKAQTDLTEEKQITKCLTLNQEQFQQKMKDFETNLKEKCDTITSLEEQQKDLMFYVTARDKLEQSVGNELTQSELDSSQIIVTQTASTSKNNRRKMK